MSNDDGMTKPEQAHEHSAFRHLNIRASFVIRHLVLPSLTGVTYGRQAFAELGLLPFGFPLLVRLARLLFGAGTRRSATD